jgi:hypothetical protein
VRSSPGHPKPPRLSSWLAVTVSLGALLAIAAGFAGLAVVSFRYIHGNIQGISNLRPVDIVGNEQTVFSWRRDACEPRDIPDMPARAYRDAAGNVHLIASHYVSRDMTGPDLNHVKHQCPVIMRSAFDTRPSRYQDHEWIAAPYTLDGRTVFALIHEEFQGDFRAGTCPPDPKPCFYAAVTLVVSSDGGRAFHHVRRAPGQLVGEVPYRYRPANGPSGLAQPSNIVAKDGYYYALASTQPYGAQEGGSCLLRSKRLGDPTAWRAWSGDGFDVKFIDPYKVRSVAADHVCEPVSPDAIGNMTMSLTYNTYFDKYLLVGTAGDYSAKKRRNVFGFYYALSDDLIHWSRRKLIREVELLETYKCGDADPVFYPSVLDPKSRSRNFETTGRQPYLYFTRPHYSGCRQTLDRDLVRVPIRFSK